MLIAEAAGLFNILAACSAPCSVNAHGSVLRPPRPGFWYRKLRCQRLKFFFGELEKEIARKLINVSTNSLIKTGCRHTINGRQIRIKNDFKSSHMPNQRMNLWRYSNGLFHIDEVRNLQLTWILWLIFPWAQWSRKKYVSGIMERARINPQTGLW